MVTHHSEISNELNNQAKDIYIRTQIVYLIRALNTSINSVKIYALNIPNNISIITITQSNLNQATS